MSSSSRLSLPYILPSQAQKHVTLNDSLRRLDVMVQGCVEARDVSAQPTSPSEGDAYILPASSSGADWGNLTENTIAIFTDGYWDTVTPQIGFRVWVKAEDQIVVFGAYGWAPLETQIAATDQLGINTSADTVNRFAVKSDSALLSHDDVTPGSGDARSIINKKTASHSASVVFQDDYQDRAEFGLLGDDEFSLKTSTDGSQFSTAMTISKARDVVEMFHPLTVKNSPVLSLDDKPCLMANIASADTSYSTNDRIDLSAGLDTHNGFDGALSEYTVPVTGIYMVQLGLVIRSVSAGVTIVRLKAYKNGTMGQSVSAVTADANITTVNDAALISFNAGDTLHIRTIFNGVSGSVQFFPTSRLILYRVA